ncbi:MAG: 4Fe-4S dicluster domain-containing protein [Sulfurospirillum sp.]|jgi:Fe-S-cluster-containing dehydrogenase component|nr:4Fe-4S dicluster domain-containing protein [Sulfurospirillum sp.]MBP9613716.1 4Fe-4S dicluster domain-containing protein [Sulfurospirillum sp.]
MARYGMALNYKNCINCRACESACKEENGVLLLKDHYRIWVGVKEAEGQFPHISIASQTYHPSQCQHCSNAPCQMVCPTNATYYGKDGMVMVDPVKCILCTYCINACPYDARYVDQRTMTVDKCTFCSDTRLAAGETTTACQATCPTKVRVFGDLDDPDSEISQLLANKEYRQVKEHLGTEPKLFYIL